MQVREMKKKASVEEDYETAARCKKEEAGLVAQLQGAMQPKIDSLKAEQRSYAEAEDYENAARIKKEIVRLEQMLHGPAS